MDSSSEKSDKQKKGEENSSTTSEKKRTIVLEEDHPNDLVRLMKKNKAAENSQMVYIGIDGYYGDDKFMTLELIRKSTKKVYEVVTNVFNIKNTNRIVWVCPLGSWMKCLPLFLVSEGIGHHVEFIAPCGEIKSNNDGIYLDMSQSKNKDGRIVMNSIEHMDDRLNEDETRRLCNVPPTKQIISTMIREKKAYIHNTTDFNMQRKKLKDLAQYAIVLPYHDPNTIMTEEQEKAYRNRHGGNLYFSKSSHQRQLINLWELMRECSLQINDCLTSSDSNKDLTNVIKWN